MAEFRWEEIEAGEPQRRSADRAAWLRRVAAGLDALPEVEAETLAELATHLDDRTAAEVATGLGQRAAEQNAMDRLGDPAALGRELGRARVAGRSRLAVAGGGALRLTAYTIGGTLAGLLALVLPVWIVAIAARLMGFALGPSTTKAPDGYALTVALAVGLAWACGAAPAALARLGARSFRGASRGVAAVVLILGLPIALFAPDRQVDLPMAVISLLVPAVGALAALTARRAHELRPAPLVIGLAVAALITPTFVWAASGAIASPPATEGWDAASDPLIGALMTSGPEGMGQLEYTGGGIKDGSGPLAELRLSNVVANGRTDPRFEVWQLSQQADGSWRSSAQLLSVAFEPDGTDLVVRFRPPAPRTPVWFVQAVTATDPDGVRRIPGGELWPPQQTGTWVGSVAGWLTAQP